MCATRAKRGIAPTLGYTGIISICSIFSILFWQRGVGQGGVLNYRHISVKDDLSA